ncbi:MAG: glycosyltransferase [Candidatus Paceibacterota bacterium]
MMMESNILISACMITYAHEKYIKEAILGILNQRTEHDVELIIADDCSTVSTKEVVEELVQNHENGDWIKYHRHYKNKGMINNFLWALKQCSGKYIALCEGDDYWTDPLKLQKQVMYLENNTEFSMCCTNYSEVDATGSVLAYRGWNGNKTNPIIDHKTILSDYKPKLLTSMIRAEYLPKQYPKELLNIKNFDNVLFALITENGPAAFMDVVTGAYRIHGDGIWGEKSSIEQNLMQIDTFEEMKKVFLKKEQQKAINQRINSVQRQLCMGYATDGNLIKSYRLFFGVYSFNFKSMKSLIKMNMKYLVSIFK